MKGVGRGGDKEEDGKGREGRREAHRPDFYNTPYSTSFFLEICQIMQLLSVDYFRQRLQPILLSVFIFQVMFAVLFFA
jgi:hypothetical protein